MFLRLILSVLLVASLSSVTADSGRALLMADEEFEKGKYTEAYEIYQNLFSQGVYSSSMLLKMAFIQDGLGNYQEALYYLDLYYKKSADRSVVGKIEEISEEWSLSGYSYDDIDFFKALLSRYKAHLQMALVTLMLFLTVYILRKKQQKEQPVTASIFQLLTIAGLFFLSNNLFETDKGIIYMDNTLVRTGPSAGAEPVTVIEKGHKVEVVEQTSVWTKIKWRGEEGFIRNGRVRII